MISKLDMKKPLKRRENGTNWIKIGTKWLTRVDVGQTEMGGTDRSIHPLPTKFHKKKTTDEKRKKRKRTHENQNNNNNSNQADEKGEATENRNENKYINKIGNEVK